MDSDIGVGIAVGLATGSSLYVWDSENFTKPQKMVLLCCVLFPPLQWVGILLILIHNKYKENNSIEKITERKIEQVKINLDNSIFNLTNLKQKGILTEEEYKQKVGEIEEVKAEQNLKNSTEYRQLKSLFDSNLLTEKEFNSKIQLINKKNSIISSNDSLNIPENYDYEVCLKNGKTIKIVGVSKSNNNIIGCKVDMNGLTLSEKYLRSENSLYFVEDGCITNYYSALFKTSTDNIALTFYCKMLNISIGDYVFYRDGDIVRDGFYSINIFKKIKVKNGKVY